MLLRKIQKLQQENKAVSNEEIETLLAAAQKEITMQKLYDEVTNTVDANVLLQSVEDDLEQSFRDKVFSAIKSGYETVKTAVAERNN
jgi:guanylate kinase